VADINTTISVFKKKEYFSKHNVLHYECYQGRNQAQKGAKAPPLAKSKLRKKDKKF